MKKNLRQFAVPIFFGSILVIVCIVEFWRKGLRLFEWDLLFVSGVALLIVGIWLSMDIPRRMEDMLTRLFNRGILQITEEELKKFKTELKTRTKIWAYRGGLIVGISMLIAWLVAYRSSFSFMTVLETILDIFGGCIAGWYLGRMASYGTLGLFLKNKEISLKVQPGHPDEVVGLRPVGDFYFYQAMVAAIPALFLAVWLVIIPFWPIPDRYTRWLDPYLGLLPLAMAFEILAFLVPIWFFHREMQRQKSVLLQEADTLSRNITQLQTELAELQDSKQYSFLKNRLSHMAKLYADIENMPTWPVDTRTRHRFTVNNVVLFFPLVSRLIGENSIWRAVLKSLEKFIES